MKYDKINNKGQARLFRNHILESLTKGHPAVIWGMYIPLISFLFYRGIVLGQSVLFLLFLFAIGVLFWTFFEYVAHRFLFHAFNDNPKLTRLAYILHGNHHHYPRDRQRLFMPPFPSVILAFLLFALQYLILGNKVYGFFPGFILGYLLYASMHYAIHAFAPPYKFLKPLWRNHHLHHYKNEERGFGVSSLFWDLVFHTQFDLDQEPENKEQVKRLMFEKKTSNQDS